MADNEQKGPTYFLDLGAPGEQEAWSSPTSFGFDRAEITVEEGLRDFVSRGVYGAIDRTLPPTGETVRRYRPLATETAGVMATTHTINPPIK